MLKRLSFLASGMASAFALLNVLAGLLGAQRPPHPALVGFVPCMGEARPCWNGIIPGVTSINEMHQIMAFAGPGVALFDDLTESYSVYFILPQPSPVCVAMFQFDQHVVGRIQLQICRTANVRVGDLTTTFGMPQQLVVIPPQDLVYNHLAVNSKALNFQPYSPISFMNVLELTQISQPFYKWHGFVPLWRYCQLEPNYPLCD
ncbi:MAG: hypothetical protein ABI690_29725 [Chloroflexota bacterium]